MENEQNNMYINTENENENSEKQIEENTKPRCCKICVGWFLQILVIAALVFLIFSCIKKFNGWYYVILGFIVIYGLYLYQFLNANTYKFLSNISNSEGIYNILEKNFTQSPEIDVNIRCYHYTGSSRRHTRGSVTKFKKTFIFPYYSWKDISGLFLLKQDKIKKYPFLKLYLKKEINFADSISYSDYTIYKNTLHEKYKDYDAHFYMYDEKIIPDFKENHLITLDPNNIPCCVSKGLYIFFLYFFQVNFIKLIFKTNVMLKILQLEKYYQQDMI